MSPQHNTNQVSYHHKTNEIVKTNNHKYKYNYNNKSKNKKNKQRQKITSTGKASPPPPSQQANKHTNTQRKKNMKNVSQTTLRRHDIFFDHEVYCTSEEFTIRRVPSVQKTESSSEFASFVSSAEDSSSTMQEASWMKNMTIVRRRDLLSNHVDPREETHMMVHDRQSPHLYPSASSSSPSSSSQYFQR